MHEYIHSLMFGHCDWKNPWKVEGFATYFSHKYDLNNLWNNAASSMIWVQEYIDAIGRPIDMQMDFREFEDLMVYAYRFANPDSAYQSGSSFIGYLVDQYGERAVIAYICSDNEYNAEWDKSYSDLVQNWWMYIEANYSQYNTDAM